MTTPGVYELEITEPSTRAERVFGSTPEPASATATDRVPPRRADGVRSLAVGGVVSLIQMRKR